ncbi:hypothetical protein [Streptomyces sp. NPDC050738]|uniref:hypothetical protein n=1 Tax=Streptomyces sp. NPDC050738 TaxID=3154744 RepID=UPI0034130E19
MTRLQRAGTAAATVMIAGALLLTGCNSLTNASPSRVVQSAPEQSVAPRTEDLPTSAELEAALLNADDLGGTFTESPPGSDSPTTGASEPSFTGCRLLADLLNTSDGDPEQKQASATFEGAGISVSETLTALPATLMDPAYTVARKALSSCGSISYVSANERIDFELTPIHFGGPDSIGVRMDGAYLGTQVNGYLLIERLGKNVVMGYVFFQAAGGSSQVASAYYRLAIATARESLGLNG